MLTEPHLKNESQIRVLIVDDEYPGCLRMIQLLKAYQNIQVVGIAHRTSQAEAVLQNSDVDLVFLDIEMPGENGIQFLKRTFQKPLVIYVTAYPHHAVSAFDVGAVDYLIKPVEEARLYHAIARAKKALALKSPLSGFTATPDVISNTPEDCLIHIKVPEKKSELMIHPSEIAWVRGMQNYTLVQLVHQAEELPVRKTMTYWSQQLESDSHPRVDKSTIIQLSLIKKMTVGSNQKTWLVLEGVDHPLTLGKAGSSRLKICIDNWLIPWH